MDKAFKNIPRQMCHFHMKKIVQRYITMRPKLEASKELKKIMLSLTKTNEINFTKRLKEWYGIYQPFLDEKTLSNTTNNLKYTHPRLRSAYRSLISNLPYLFTYKNKQYKDLNIKNTTNSIEGGIFSHMKNMVSLHRGITKGKKLLLIDFYLINMGQK